MVVYISPTGSDGNSGTINSPWFTINKAWASSADIIYVRGGTYFYTSDQIIENKSGITIMNYNNEVPVFDFKNVIGGVTGLFVRGVSNIFMKGFRITNAVQPAYPTNIACYGLILWDNVKNSKFELIEADHIGGWGFVIGENCSDILFLNCDSHHNADPNTGNGDPYGWSDGFESASPTSTNIIFRGCRAWRNSDDGWDLRRANGYYLIENCWSFWNGKDDNGVNHGGNGEGFKLGGKSAPATTTILRTIKNSLAFENYSVGFTPEPDSTENELGVEMYNCTSYKNALGINFEYGNTAIVRNNIIFANSRAMYSWGSHVTNDHNSFDAADADFLSVSSVGADGPRQSDGSLPSLNFLKLAKGSKLVNAGVNVGIPYSGTAPDLGAYEFNNNMATITTEKGTYQVTAVVLPADATDKSLTWSITGPATVSQTGLVTATGDGTATVKATAKDGSGVFGTLPIVITGQKVLVTAITLS